MTTEAKQRTNGLGWDNYPQPLTPEQEDQLCIREAKSSELPYVKDVRDAVFFPNRSKRTAYKDELDRDYAIDTIHGVAVIQGDIVAIGLVQPTPDSVDADNPFRLSSLGVLPTHRRNDIGSNVVGFLEEQAREQGATSISLDSANTCISFYTRLGYVIDSVFGIQNGQTPMRKDLTLPEIV